MTTIFKMAQGHRDARVEYAIQKVHSEFNKICNEVAYVKGFAFADKEVTGVYLKSHMEAFVGHMYVHIYTPKNPFSKAIGYYDSRYPDRIYLNKKKLARSPGSIAATLIHELVHAIDDRDFLYSYGHGSNKWTIEKEKSAPYKSDDITEIIIDNKPSTTPKERKVNSRITRKIRRWYKPWTWF